MYKVRLRGFYATALTRLLLDEGFEAVQLSPEAQQRFGMGENPYAYDVTIHDRPDLQGVEARGSTGALDELHTAFMKQLLDAIVRSHPVSRAAVSTPSSEARGFLDAEFPSLSKAKLDAYRSCVVPTLPGHHYYRAAGGSLASALSMAEKLLLAGRDAEEVQLLLAETVQREYPIEGDRLSIRHVKLSGAVLDLGRALIEDHDEKGAKLRLRRAIRPGGLYDGLDVRKEEGDHAVTEAKVGAWSTKTTYFSREGASKGTYVNLNTPVELYPDAVRYVDLEADLALTPLGETRVLDEEKLDLAAETGLVSQELVRKAKEELRKLLDST